MATWKPCCGYVPRGFICTADNRAQVLGEALVAKEEQHQPTDGLLISSGLRCVAAPNSMAKEEHFRNLPARRGSRLASEMLNCSGAYSTPVFGIDGRHAGHL